MAQRIIYENQSKSLKKKRKEKKKKDGQPSWQCVYSWSLAIFEVDALAIKA